MNFRTRIAKSDCSIDGVYYKRGETIMVFDEEHEKKVKKSNVRLAMRIDLRWKHDEIVRQLKKHGKETLDGLMAAILIAKKQQKDEKEC